MIGRQDIKNKTTSAMPDRLKIFINYLRKKNFYSGRLKVVLAKRFGYFPK